MQLNKWMQVKLKSSEVEGSHGMSRKTKKVRYTYIERVWQCFMTKSL